MSLFGKSYALNTPSNAERVATSGVRLQGWLQGPLSTKSRAFEQLVVAEQPLEFAVSAQPASHPRTKRQQIWRPCAEAGLW